jgi:hypothetical protein
VLQLSHPVSSEPLRIEAPLALDLEQAIAALARDVGDAAPA